MLTPSLSMAVEDRVLDRTDRAYTTYRPSPGSHVRGAAGFVFDVVGEGQVADAGAAGGGVVAGEIPVAAFRGDGGVEVFHGLEEHYQLAAPVAFRIHKFADPAADLSIRERFVDGFHRIHLLRGGLLQLGFGMAVGFVD